MGIKKMKVCEICGKKDFKNRKDNHHLIPKSKGGWCKERVWLCVECHTMLHIAESKGLCELPKKTDRRFRVENSRTKGLMDRGSRISVSGINHDTIKEIRIIINKLRELPM